MRTRMKKLALPLALLALGALGLVALGGGEDEATAAEATVAPETTITKASRYISIGSPPQKCTGPRGWTRPGCKPTHKKTATFEFTADQAGATFECAGVFDREGASRGPNTPRREPFTPCTSPLKVKVGTGKHEFEVRATVGGVTDDTPAEAYWVRVT
jgi:hypothetical protein